MHFSVRICESRGTRRTFSSFLAHFCLFFYISYLILNTTQYDTNHTHRFQSRRPYTIHAETHRRHRDTQHTYHVIRIRNGAAPERNQGHSGHDTEQRQYHNVPIITLIDYSIVFHFCNRHFFSHYDMSQLRNSGNFKSFLIFNAEQCTIYFVYSGNSRVTAH